MRWMGLAGIAGGVIWAGRYVIPLDPGSVARAYGHIALSLLFIAGLAGFYLQQGVGATRTAKAGFTCLFLSLGAWSALNILGTVFGVDDGALVMNVLGLAFVLPMAPGFLLLGIGLRGWARSVPLTVGAAFVAWLLAPRLLSAYFPVMATWNRGDSPLGVLVFFLMGVGVAAIGFSVFRQAERPTVR